MRTWLIAGLAVTQAQLQFELADDKPLSTVAEKLTENVSVPTATAAGSAVPDSVIIVGAGASAIKTAHTMLTNGFKGHIRFVEAGPEFGGRMKTHEWKEAGVILEAGANWVSGTTFHKKTNPVWELAQEFKLKGVMEDDDQDYPVFDTKGNDLTDYYDSREKVFDRAVDRIEHMLDTDQLTKKNDQSMRALLAKFGWPKPQTAIDMLVEYNKVDQENAEPAERSSAYFWFTADKTYDDWGENDYFVQDPRGYKVILSKMVQDLLDSGRVMFHYGYSVEEVDYAPGNVGVTGTHNGEPFSFKADSVISSVSVGVLNANDISFQPAFPEWKKTAISQIEMGLEDKVFLAIPKANAGWIPTTRNFAIASQTKGQNLEFTNWGETATHKILMVFEIWSKAKSLEGASESTIINEMETLLKASFGAKATDNGQFRAEHAFMTSWWNDKYFRGAYSFLRTSAFANIPWSDLTDPITGTNSRDGFKTLYFTGEGLSKDYGGYVHGAFEAGEVTGKQVMGI